MHQVLVLGVVLLESRDGLFTPELGGKFKSVFGEVDVGRCRGPVHKDGSTVVSEVGNGRRRAGGPCQSFLVGGSGDGARDDSARFESGVMMAGRASAVTPSNSVLNDRDTNSRGSEDDRDQSGCSDETSEDSHVKQ